MLALIMIHVNIIDHLHCFLKTETNNTTTHISRIIKILVFVFFRKRGKNIENRNYDELVTIIKNKIKL